MSVDSAAAQPLTPDSLIEQCLSGDQAAWELIVRQNWRKVFNVAYKFVGKHDEAEDLTQDIFLKIFKALATFDRRGQVTAVMISTRRTSPRTPHLRRRASGFARHAARRAPGAARDAADGGCAARSAGALVSGDRRAVAVARGHGEIAHQSRPVGAGAPAQTAAGQT